MRSAAHAGACRRRPAGAGPPARAAPPCSARSARRRSPPRCGPATAARAARPYALAQLGVSDQRRRPPRRSRRRPPAAPASRSRPGVDQVERAAGGRCDHRYAAGHRLLHGLAERLVRAGVHEHVQARVDPGQLVAAALRRGRPRRGRAFSASRGRAVTDHHQPHAGHPGRRRPAGRPASRRPAGRRTRPAARRPGRAPGARRRCACPGGTASVSTPRPHRRTRGCPARPGRRRRGRRARGSGRRRCGWCGSSARRSPRPGRAGSARAYAATSVW